MYVCVCVCVYINNILIYLNYNFTLKLSEIANFTGLFKKKRKEK